MLRPVYAKITLGDVGNRIVARSRGHQPLAQCKPVREPDHCLPLDRFQADCKQSARSSILFSRDVIGQTVSSLAKIALID
jgi:hypothetical protein